MSLPLPEPQYFAESCAQAYLADQVTVAITEELNQVAILITRAVDNSSTIWACSPAQARQFAALVLNKADRIDPVGEQVGN